MYLRNFLYNITRGICSSKFLLLPSAKVRPFYKCITAVNNNKGAAIVSAIVYAISNPLRPHISNHISSFYIGIKHHFYRNRGSATLLDDDRKETSCDNAKQKSPCVLPCPYQGYNKAIAYWFPAPSLTTTEINCGHQEDAREICNRKRKGNLNVAASPSQEDSFFQEQTDDITVHKLSSKNNSSGTAASEEDEDWWQGCQSQFWQVVGNGTRQISRTVYLGSTTIFGNETDSKLGKAKLIWRILCPVVPSSESVFNIKDQAQSAFSQSTAASAAQHRSSSTDASAAPLSTPAQQQASSSSHLTSASKTSKVDAAATTNTAASNSDRAPSSVAPRSAAHINFLCHEKTDLEQPDGSVDSDSVGGDKEETLDSLMEEFKAMLVEYQAHSESLLGLEAVEAGDLCTAVEHMHTSALLGNASAAFNLGLCYETGRGVAHDKEKAVYFYKKASASDHSEACFNLALLYLDHQTDMPESSSSCVAALCEDSWRSQQGLAMLQKAAGLGLKEAQSYLGVLYFERSDMAGALPYFKAAAAQDDSDAQYFLAMFHSSGWGLEASDEKAAELYTRAAAQGHAHATYSLGVMHELGAGGLREDRAAAVAKYQQAAELGCAEAVFRLAHLTHADDLCLTTAEDRDSQQQQQPLQNKATQQGTTAPQQQGGTSAHALPNEGTSALNSSASSPTLTYHRKQAENDAASLLGKLSKQIHSFKVLFDPGGRGRGTDKVKFDLGSADAEGDNDRDSGHGSDTASPRSCDSGCWGESPDITLPTAFPFQKSATMPCFDLALK